VTRIKPHLTGFPGPRPTTPAGPPVAALMETFISVHRCWTRLGLRCSGLDSAQFCWKCGVQHAVAAADELNSVSWVGGSTDGDRQGCFDWVIVGDGVEAAGARPIDGRLHDAEDEPLQSCAQQNGAT
jgi:hypothetical protein